MQYTKRATGCHFQPFEGLGVGTVTILDKTLWQTCVDLKDECAASHVTWLRQQDGEIESQHGEGDTTFTMRDI